MTELVQSHKVQKNSLGSEFSNALGIGAASFWSGGGNGSWRRSEKRYSGKPDGRAGTPRNTTNTESTYYIITTKTAKKKQHFS